MLDTAFDPLAISRRLEQIRNGETTTPPEPPVTEQPEFELYPSRIGEAFTAIAGLADYLTASGRSQKAHERADMLNQRFDVIQHAGEVILDRNQHGWPGIHRFDSSRQTRRREDFDNLGNQILYAHNVREPYPDNATARTRTDKNMFKPVTRVESRAVRKLVNMHDKSSRHMREADWLSSEYGPKLDASTGYLLSSSERSHYRGISKKIIRSDTDSKDLLDNFKRIAARDTFRGRIDGARLLRAEDYDARIARRNDRIQAARDRAMHRAGYVVGRSTSAATKVVKKSNEKVAAKAVDWSNRAARRSGRIAGRASVVASKVNERIKKRGKS